MQGKLVPQIPSEGTAEELLKELKSKKQELIQEGIVLKKKETVPFYQPEDLAVYNIPNSWRWVKLSDVSIIQEGAGIRKWQYRNKGTQVLCVTNILDGRIDLVKKTLFIDTDEFKEKYLHLKINDGDIVTSCSGGSWGKVAVFESDKTLMLNTSTLRLRFFGDLAFNMYLYYVCTTPLFKQQLSEQLSGMQPNFGYAHYSRIMIPLPPIEEQKRICKKLSKLLITAQGLEL